MELRSITSFVARCHEHYTSCSFCFIGLENQASQFIGASNKEARIFFGDTHPDEGLPYSKIQIGKFIEYASSNGKFTDELIKSTITFMYSEWDEYYRHEVAKEIGVPAKSIRSDLIGDLRHIRNCIVHNKSQITNQYKKIKVLHWELSEGKLMITKDMFKELIKQINEMTVYVNEEN